MNHQNTIELELVFGGTFDPPHFAHLSILENLHQHFPKLPIRVLPCATPALKVRPSTSFEQRVAMLKLAFDSLPADLQHKIIIDPREKSRDGASYTVDSLKSLTATFPDRRFVWVMGADSVASLAQWYQADKLSLLTHLIIFNRSGSSTNQIKAGLQAANFEIAQNWQALTKQPFGQAFLLKMAEKRESSSEIRQNCQNKQELDSMLPQSVIKYIIQHQLYQ